MRFDLTEDQELMRDTARRFLERDASIAALRNAADAPGPWARDIWRKACELGWAALAAPDDAGGYSLSGGVAQDLSILAEEIGRLAAPGFLIPCGVSLQALAQSPEQLQVLAGPILAGDAVVAWAFGERGNRWNSVNFDTEAKLAGDEVVLNGVKAYVEGGGDAAAFVVTARGAGGLTQVAVPADHPGVTVTPARSLDLARQFAQVAFENVRLPRTALLGEGGGADAAAERQLQLAMLLQCADTNGALERTFEFTIAYMGDRHAFGRPIASYQALKHRLADLLVQLHSCMATTDAALEAYDAGSPEAGRLARIAKAYVGARSMKMLGDLVQLTGGIGVTWEHDLHIYERRCAINRALFGAPEAHRARIHQMITA